MTRFEDGPAAFQALTLSRSPVFLRVVEEGGKWDALDLLEDAPRATEHVYVYVLVRREGNAFMCGRDPKTGKRTGRHVAYASYRLLAEQPADEVVRDNGRWAAWAEKTGKEMFPEGKGEI